MFPEIKFLYIIIIYIIQLYSSHFHMDFQIIIDDFRPEENITRKVRVENETLGFVFYASGNMQVKVESGKKRNISEKSGGLASSFYLHPQQTSVTHYISKASSLQKVSVFCSPHKIIQLIGEECLLTESLKPVLKPGDFFSEGPQSGLTPEMLSVIHKVRNNQLDGALGRIFMESQATELLAYYFQNTLKRSSEVSKPRQRDYEKLYFAKEVLVGKMDDPPSLAELSKIAGLNTFKLKKGFNELFGMPVYKFLQDTRMKKAAELLKQGDMNVQEVAFSVGYESLSSFSNTFYRIYGVRPSMSGK